MSPPFTMLNSKLAVCPASIVQARPLISVIIESSERSEGSAARGVTVSSGAATGAIPPTLASSSASAAPACFPNGNLLRRPLSGPSAAGGAIFAIAPCAASWAGAAASMAFVPAGLPVSFCADAAASAALPFAAAAAPFAPAAPLAPAAPANSAAPMGSPDAPPEFAPGAPSWNRIIEKPPSASVSHGLTPAGTFNCRR